MYSLSEKSSVSVIVIPFAEKSFPSAFAGSSWMSVVARYPPTAPSTTKMENTISPFFQPRLRFFTTASLLLLSKRKALPVKRLKRGLPERDIGSCPSGSW